MTNVTVVSDLRRAETILSRVIGLLGKRSLPEGHGLLIAPCNQVHTLFMRFTIDVIFLDKTNKILKISRSLKPWKCSPIVWKAKSVLELSEGGAESLNVGDQLTLHESTVTL